MEAARSGRLEIVQLLIDKVADVNAKDKTGATVLIAAAETGRSKIYQFLTNNVPGFTANAVRDAADVMAAAGRRSARYVLVMSKDNRVCRHMLRIYNQDLRRFGEIRHDQHEEFHMIQWEEKIYHRGKQGRKNYSSRLGDNPVFMSRFDINNDGDVEVIIKDPYEWLSGRPYEGVYYFANQQSEPFKNEGFDGSILDGSTIKIGASGVGFDKGHYSLKELPMISNGLVGDKETFNYYRIGPYFYINPLLFNGVYYIDISDSDYRPAGWRIIIKYTKENKPTDTCYFLKTCDCDAQGGQ
jgi:hypothetical protein